MQPAPNPQLAVCLALTRSISHAQSLEAVYSVALEALADGLHVHRVSIRLFDSDGVMRFRAHHGLSETYRRSVERYMPWQPGTVDPLPIVVNDVTLDPTFAEHLPLFVAEGIGAMLFIPLTVRGIFIGQFVAYYDAPQLVPAVDVQLAQVIATLLAFAVEHRRAEDVARNSEEQLRFALGAASMGTWEWDIVAQTVRWSDNLERVHGLPAGTFDGTFASYEREIHPEDRPGVLGSLRSAIEEGSEHDVEYRIVAPDGRVSWVEGKGRVQRDEQGRPVKMTGVCILATRRKEAELARLAAAEEASRLKDDFLATLSHELRTPMNAVIGWVQMLKAGSLPPERMQQAFDVIGRNARLQAQLVEDLLDVSRIVSGKLHVDMQPVAISQIVEHVIIGVMPAADARRIMLTKDLDDCPDVTGDAKRLEQIVANVLSNAVKFTNEGGRIDVRCRTVDATVQIEVQDDGVGIPAEFLPYVFDRFRQADSGSTRSHGGLGLGLAIAQHLVHLHNGEIRAQSDGVGRGTTIVIRIPDGNTLGAATCGD